MFAYLLNLLILHGIYVVVNSYVPFNSDTLSLRVNNTNPLASNWWLTLKKSTIKKSRKNAKMINATTTPTSVTAPTSLSLPEEEFKVQHKHANSVTESPLFHDKGNYFSKATIERVPHPFHHKNLGEGRPNATFKPKILEADLFTSTFLPSTSTATLKSSSVRFYDAEQIVEIKPKKNYIFYNKEYTTWLFNIFMGELNQRGLISQVEKRKAINVFLNLLTDIGTTSNGSKNKNKVIAYVSMLKEEDFDNLKRFELKNDDLQRAKEMLEKLFKPFKDKFKNKTFVLNEHVNRATVTILKEYSTTTRPQKNMVTKKSIDSRSKFFISKNMKKDFFKNLLNERKSASIPIFSPSPIAKVRASLPHLENSIHRKHYNERFFGGVSSDSIAPKTVHRRPNEKSNRTEQQQHVHDQPLIRKLISSVEKLRQKLGSNFEEQSVRISALSSSVKEMLSETLKKSE